MATQKRGGGRRMNQMNGDFLAQLKEPLRSEVNRDVLGTNKATIKVMNRNLDMHFKEKNIAVERIRRKQEDLYVMMLRVHREKKILQRATYKKKQEELHRTTHKHRRDLGKPDVLEIKQEGGDAKDDTKVPEETKAEEGKPADDAKEDKSPDRPQKRNYETRSRVLEVSKKTPLAPIVRERSVVTADPDPSTETPATTKTAQPASRTPPRQLKDKELSVSDIAIASVADAQKVKSEHKPPSGEESGTDSPNNKRRTKSSKAMPTISEKDSKDAPAQNSENTPPTTSPKKKRCKKDSKPSAPVLPPIQNTCNDSVDHSLAPCDSNNTHSEDVCQKPKGLSLVERNRKKARAKLRNRHKILNEESFGVYVKDANGTYVPTLAPFKRKEFTPPSLREKHFQQKMLRAQVEARLDQRQKLESFFERMAQEELERQRIRDAFKKAMEMEQEAERRKFLEEQQKVGFSASQMATLYSSGVLPPGVDPNSFEAIKYCKYIRAYSPTGQEEADHRDGSWGK